jgi:hypothetical protein
MKKEIKLVTLDGKAKVSINIPMNILEMIDADRADNNYSRSAWITMAAMERLHKKKKET